VNHQNVDVSLFLKESKEFIQYEFYPQDESRTTEFKSLTASRQPLARIIDLTEKYMNAFLNAEGGTIHFGIEDDGMIVGLSLNR
jgi:predicted HTH transcriptional regulator